MRNPFYEGPAEEPEALEEIDVITERVRKYLADAPHVEEFDVVKLRRLHPELADDKVWQEVRRRIEGDREPGGRNRA